jgi:predicted nucleic acid-binding Zn ribbon protein
MRRTAPRHLSHALEHITAEVGPATPLARVQECWSRVAGDVVAREAEPVSERDGVVVVQCASAVWAGELEMLAPDLVERLNHDLGTPLVKALRVRGGRPSRRS